MLRAILPLAILIGGCHARFKKLAPTIDAVHTQILVTTGPNVELGHIAMGSSDPEANALLGVVNAAVNIAQEVQEVDLTTRIAGAVHPADIASSLDQGLAETLGSGPPFAYDGEAGALLQLEIIDYGMYVPSLGAPGTFTFTARARVYTADGKKAYRNVESCSTGVGDPEAGAVVLGVVNNVKQLKEMSDEQINETFAAVARYCGSKFVTKIRKHAG